MEITVKFKKVRESDFYEDLEDFSKLPPAFTADVEPLIGAALDEFFECRAYVAKALEFYGDYSYKNPASYERVEREIYDAQLPSSFEVKLLAVLHLLKDAHCNGDDDNE